MSEVILVLLSKLCSLQNIMKKSELIQTVPVPKSCDFSETITVCTPSPMSRVSKYLRFTGLTYPTLCYKTLWRVAILLVYWWIRHKNPTRRVHVLWWPHVPIIPIFSLPTRHYPQNPNVYLVQPTFNMIYSHFDSSELLALDLIVYSWVTPTNITIMDDPIFNIPQTPQVP